MSNNCDITLLSVQKITKPKIEDVVLVSLEDAVKESALEFIAYMRKNKMQPTWLSHNTWKANYKGKGICSIRLPKSYMPYKYWSVCPHVSRWNKLISSYNLFEEQIIDSGSQNIVWDNVNICRSCANCGPGWDMSFLGKEFKNVCHNIPVWYCDPGELEIDFIKKILDLMKQTIADNKV